MNALTTSVALCLSICAVWQDQTPETRAVQIVRQTPASQFDPRLPARPFGRWFDQTVGPGAGATWLLTDCGGQSEAGESDRDLPACIVVTAILPNERKVTMQFLVGSFKLGLSGSAKLQFSAIEANNRLHSVARLGDLPQMLRRPLPKSRTRPVVLPNIGRNRSSIYLSPPALIDPPQAGARLAAEETPAPRPAWSAQPRTFRGLSASEIITRVSPVYPPPAKEFNAFGEVRVEITADEKGRVIDARAISGHVMLYKAAEEAARRWVFKPVFIDGKPARRESTLTFIFTRPQ